MTYSMEEKVAASLLFIPALLASGFVAMKLWFWFVVPATGLAPLTYPLSIGIELTAGVFCKNALNAQVEMPPHHKVAKSIIINFIALFIGWLVHLFV